MFLAIETSHPRASLALFDGEGVHAEEVQDGTEHAREIAVSIERILGRAGARIADLTGIAVGIGPGSYTGCRVAVVTAKTICLARRLPLLAESSLAILAEGARAAADLGVRSGDRVRALLDARRGSVFTALFAIEETTLQRLEPDRVVTTEELVPSVEPSWLVGAQAEAFAGELAAERRDRFPTLPAQAPRAADLAALVRPRLATARYDSEAIHALAPAYLQASRPERLREERLREEAERLREEAERGATPGAGVRSEGRGIG